MRPMDTRLEHLCEGIFGAKRFKIFALLCQRADENGFVLTTIEQLASELGFSKPTIISAFKFLEEKRLLKRLKNGFYELKIGAKNDS